MRLISAGEAARRLGIDPLQLRRHVCSDKNGREFLMLDGMRINVYRKGALRNRSFDATEIAYHILQRERRRRFAGE